jgi:hypothetical protein
VSEIQWDGVNWKEAIAFGVGVELSALNHLLLDGLLLPLPMAIKLMLKG